MIIRTKQRLGSFVWIDYYPSATLRKTETLEVRVPSIYPLLELVVKLLSSLGVLNPLKGNTQMHNINRDLDYFTREEFACQYTGDNEISDDLLLKIDLLRARCGFPFVITSGYRSEDHPIERKKEKAIMPKELQRTLKLGTGTHAVHQLNCSGH